MSKKPNLSILYNGKVVTVDKSFSVAEAVAIGDGRFLGEAYLINFAILLILVVLYFPEGSVGIFDRLKSLTLPPSRAR